MSNTQSRWFLRGGLILLAWLILVPTIEAGSDEEIFRDFPFNFGNPGARALGVGGAFISLADDSTAAQANPAGLVVLRRPEFFAEFNAQSYDSSEVAVATTLNTPFFQGTLSASATASPRSGLNPTFLSYVLPLKKVALGFSRFETLNVQTRTSNAFSIVVIKRSGVYGLGNISTTLLASTYSTYAFLRIVELITTGQLLNSVSCNNCWQTSYPVAPGSW